MGRKIRRVVAEWQHPKNENGNYIPLFEGSLGVFKKHLSDWLEEEEQWNKGFRENYEDGEKWIPKDEDMTYDYTQWNGDKPKEEDYMPDWTEEQLTHIQLYEDTSEGTPITPVYRADELEQLCEYAAEHCTVFADIKATKQEWFDMLNDGFVGAKVGNVIFI